MTKARNLSLLSTVEAGATADQTKADLNAIGVSGGRKNLIINGGFDVWQRGTTLSTEGYCADRWTYGTSGGAGVHSRQQHTAADMDTFGQQYFHRLAVSSGNNNQGMSTLLEDVTRFAGKTLTLSFYAKGTNPAFGSMDTVVGTYMGSGGSGASEYYATGAITLTASWQRFTVQITVASLVGKTLGTGSYLYVYPARQTVADTGTAAWQMDIANVQLELGSVATDFEHRSYGEELALCQRYFEKRDYVSGAIVAMGHAQTSSIVSAALDYSPKRIVPTITLPYHASSSGSTIAFLTAGGSWPSTFGSLTVASASKNNCRIQQSSGGSYSSGNASWLHAGGSPSITIDAEL